jgi:hypothetical protein
VRGQISAGWRPPSTGAMSFDQHGVLLRVAHGWRQPSGQRRRAGSGGWVGGGSAAVACAAMCAVAVVGRVM